MIINIEQGDVLYINTPEGKYDVYLDEDGDITIDKLKSNEYRVKQ